MRAFKGVQQGTVVGQAGLEYYYDRYLRGVPGEQRIAVNAEGQPVPSKLAPIPPHAGHTLQTTLDVGLQKASEKALLEGMEHARAGGKPGDRRSLRRARSAQRRSARDGLLAELRPEQVRQTAHLRRIQRAHGSQRRRTRPPHQSRRRRRIPNRLDLQADHRDGGARSRRDHAGRGARGGAVHLRLDRAVLQCRARRIRERDARGSAEGVLGHVLLHRRQARQRTRRRSHPAQGARTGGGGADGHRPAERVHRRDPQPHLARRRERAGSQMRARAPRTPLLHRRRTRGAVDRRLQHGPRGRAGRAADRPAADGRRVLDARQRLPQRRQRHGRDPAPRQADRRSQQRPLADAALPQPPRAAQRRRPPAW